MYKKKTKFLGCLTNQKAQKDRVDTVVQSRPANKKSNVAQNSANFALSD